MIMICFKGACMEKPANPEVDTELYGAGHTMWFSNEKAQCSFRQHFISAVLKNHDETVTGLWFESFMCENKPQVLRQNSFVTNLKNGPNKLYSKIDRVYQLVADQSVVTSQKKIEVHVDDAQDLQEILAKVDELLKSMKYNFNVRHPGDAMNGHYGQPIPKRKLLSIEDKSDEETIIDEESSQEDELAMEDPDQMMNINDKDTKSLSGDIQDVNPESCINSHNDANSESSCSAITHEDKENLDTNLNDIIDLLENAALPEDVNPITQEIDNVSKEESKEQQHMTNIEATNNIKNVEENEGDDEIVTEDEDVSGRYNNPDEMAKGDSNTGKSNNEAKTDIDGNDEAEEEENEDTNDSEEDADDNEEETDDYEEDTYDIEEDDIDNEEVDKKDNNVVDIEVQKLEDILESDASSTRKRSISRHYMEKIIEGTIASNSYLAEEIIMTIYYYLFFTDDHQGDNTIPEEVLKSSIDEDEAYIEEADEFTVDDSEPVEEIVTKTSEELFEEGANKVFPLYASFKFYAQESLNAFEALHVVMTNDASDEKPGFFKATNDFMISYHYASEILKIIEEKKNENLDTLVEDLATNVKGMLPMNEEVKKFKLSMAHRAKLNALHNQQYEDEDYEDAVMDNAAAGDISADESKSETFRKRNLLSIEEESCSKDDPDCSEHKVNLYKEELNIVKDYEPMSQENSVITAEGHFDDEVSSLGIKKNPEDRPKKKKDRLNNILEQCQGMFNDLEKNDKARKKLMKYKDSAPKNDREKMKVVAKFVERSKGNAKLMERYTRLNEAYKASDHNDRFGHAILLF